MKKKAPFATLSTAALTAALVVTPFASASANDQVNQVEDGFYFKTAGIFVPFEKFLELSSDEINELIMANDDDFTTIYAVVGGNYATLEDAMSSDFNEVATAPESEIFENTQYKNYTTNEPVENPFEEVDVVSVVSVSAINETTIEVTFSDGTVKEIELTEALVDGANEVTFEHEGKEYTETVEFTATPVATTIEVSEVTIEEGRTVALDAKVLDQKGNVMENAPLTYKINKTSVATVDAKGNVTAKAYAENNATAVITVTSGAATATATVTVTEDTTLPEATVEVVNNKQILVKFSEEVQNIATINTDYNFSLLSKAGDELLDDSGSSIYWYEDKKTALITLETGVELAPAQYTLTLNPADNAANIKDLAGNAVYKGTELYFTPTAAQLVDKTAPALQKAEYNNGTRELTLKFDEKLSLTKDVTKVTFAGKTFTVTGAPVAINGNQAVFTLTEAFAKDLVLTGDVKVAINGAFQDEATTPNKVVTEASVKLVTPPTLATANAVDSSFDETTQILTVKFNEPVTVENIAKFELASAQALSSASKVIEGDGTDTIKIQVAKADYDKFKVVQTSAATSTVDLLVKAGAVADLEETANLETTKVAIKYTFDKVVPTVQSVKYNNQTDKLVVEFSENVQVSSATNIKLTDGTTTLTATSATAKDNIVEVVLATSTPNDLATLEGWLDAGKEVKLHTTAAGDLKDIAGNNLALITADKGIVVKLEDEVAPTVTSASAVSKNKVTIAFSEKVDTTTAQAEANYTIYDNQNDKTVTVTAAEVLADGKTVALTTEELTVKTADNYSVSVKNVKDAEGNRIGASNNTATFGLASIDSTKPVVASATYTTVAGTNNDKITVTFVEAGSGLDLATAQDLSNYTLYADGDAVDLTGAKVTVAGNVVTVTLTNGVNLKSTGVTYTMDIFDVADVAGNVMDEVEEKSVIDASSEKTVPTIEKVTAITTVDGDTLEIEFSEAVDKDSALEASYVVKSGADSTGATILPAPNAIEYVEIDANNDGVAEKSKVVLSFDSASFGVYTALDLVADEVLDLAGNKLAAVTAEVATNKDGIAPTVTEVTANTVEGTENDTITVKFSENVNTASAQSKENYVIKDAEGNVISSDKYSIAYVVGTTTATITFNGATAETAYNLKTGASYTVEVDGVLDSGSNKAVHTETVVATGDDELKFTVADVENTNEVVLAWGEDLDLAASTIKSANFKVVYDVDGDFTTTNDQVIYTVASVATAGANATTLTLLENLPAAAAELTDKIKVIYADGTVADFAGNVITTFEAEAEVK